MVRSIAAALIALPLAAPVTYAEEPVAAPPPATNIRASIEKVRFDVPPLPLPPPPRAMQQQQGTPVATKLRAALGGGVAGAFLGAVLGVPFTLWYGGKMGAYAFDGAAAGALVAVAFAPR